jgi:protein associated with RNAse G/E
VLRTVDLDLDVVRPVDDEVFVDDEDEFAAHQVEFGYPDDVIAGATTACEGVRAAVAARMAPYDGSHERWQAILAGLGV